MLIKSLSVRNEKSLSPEFKIRRYFLFLLPKNSCQKRILKIINTKQIIRGKTDEKDNPEIIDPRDINELMIKTVEIVLKIVFSNLEKKGD